VGILVVRPKLDSPRPTPEGQDPPRSHHDNSIAARLWQDPLAGFLGKHQQPAPQDKASMQRIIAGMPGKEQGVSDDLDPDTEKKPVLFRLMHIDARSDPSAVEGRRRLRYATLAALNTAEYVPTSSDRLSYVTELPRSSTEENETARSRQGSGNPTGRAEASV